nr:hypothetical protein [bacterium]
MRKNDALRVSQTVAALVLMLCLPLAAHAEWESYLYETFDSTETMFPTGTFGEATYSVDSQGRYIVNGMD